MRYETYLSVFKTIYQYLCDTIFFFLFSKNIFPEAGTVYDYMFVKQASGSWARWIDTIDKSKFTIPANAKVSAANIISCNLLRYKFRTEHVF